MIKSQGLKSIHIFISSLLICLVHLPFVFAKSKSKIESATPGNPAQPAIFSNSSTALQPVMEANTYAGMYDSLKLASLGLAKQAFDYAIRGFNYMKESGRIANDNIISIVDFSKPSSHKRLFIIDLQNYKLLFNTYVAHGVNSGREFAKQFSNTPESNKSSLGFYETSSTYIGKHGYSLHLVGVEKGINDNAYKRDIVIHSAEYVNETMIREKGYIGRSWGCPAIPEKLHRQIIDKIKNGTCLFIFGEDKNYRNRSAFLRNMVPDLAYNK